MKKQENSHIDFLLNRKQLLKSKCSQAQIIVTVLIILIVLGIIAFVGTFITRTVREGTEQAESKADCIGIELFIKEAVDGSPISIERGVGGPKNISVLVYVNGSLSETLEIDELETVKSSANAATGQEIQIAAQLEDETLCEFADSVTVA